MEDNRLHLETWLLYLGPTVILLAFCDTNRDSQG